MRTHAFAAYTDIQTWILSTNLPYIIYDFFTPLRLKAFRYLLIDVFDGDDWMLAWIDNSAWKRPQIIAVLLNSHS